MKRLLGIACAIVLVPSLAAAQPKTPEEWYKEGENQYNLGNFDAAVKAFKEGFAQEPIESKKAAYLYNIAQSYRQAKDCSNALFFYKRFLSLKDQDTTRPLAPAIRKDVEDRIKELDECAKQQEAIKNKPPDSTGVKPDGPDTTKPDTTKPDTTKPDTTKPDTKVGTKPDGEEEEEENVEKNVEVGGQPKLVSARFIAGGSKVSMGDISVPLQATFGVIGGYPLPLNEKMTLEAGIAFGYTRVKWDAMATTGKTGTASMTSLMANAGLMYEVAPKMAVRGDLGLGLLFFGGTSESPFTDNKPTEGGALAMFHVRIGASFDYAITPNIVATVPLAFSFSPKKDGLSEDMSSITTFDFMLGVGYRM